MGLTILLASATTFVVASGDAAARSAGQNHSDQKGHKDRDDKHASSTRPHHGKKHKKKTVMCIKAPCPTGSGGRSGKGTTKQAGDANKDKPVTTPTGGLRPAKGDVVVSEGSDRLADGMAVEPVEGGGPKAAE